MLYICPHTADIFEEWYQQTGGNPWSEAGEHSFSKSTWRGSLTFKQPLGSGDFNIGGQGVGEMSELWGEFVKYLNEEQENNDEST